MVEMCALVGILVLSIASLLALPAAAQPPIPDLPPLVTSDPLPGEGTVAYRFTVPEGAALALGLEASFTDFSIVGDGIWLFDPERRLLFGGWGTGIGDGPLEYHIEAPEPIGVVVDRSGPRASAGGFGSFAFLSGLPAGQYIAVMGTTSDGSFVSATAALYGTEGTVLISKTQTAGGFIHREADFRGLNAFVGVGPRAKAIVGAAVEENVQRFLFGEFSYFGDAELARLTVDGPEGTQSSTFGHFLALEPPGDYRFVIDADVGFGDLQAWGVQASLPAPQLPGTGA